MYARRLRQAARSNTNRTPPPPPTTPTAPQETKDFENARFQYFFGESSRFCTLPEEEDIQDDFEDIQAQALPDRTPSPWESDLIQAVNLVATMFGYRDIKCDHVHFTRNFDVRPGSSREVLYDARAAVGNTDQPIASAEDDEESPITRLYWQTNSDTHTLRFINNWDWTLDTTDAIGYLLRVLAKKGLSFDIPSFFELLAITNRCKDPSLEERRKCLREVKEELDELYGYSQEDEGYSSM